MDTHAADYETNESPQEAPEGIPGKLLFISRYVIAVLALALAAISLFTIFVAG